MKNRDAQNKITLGKLLSILFEWPLVEVVAEGWKYGRKLWNGHAHEGMYKVLEYKVTYEIKDKHGKEAHINKQQRVKYLQNNIFSYRDQAWGDGEILLNYQCSPGKAVDQYRIGHKTYILISLHEVKERGDIDEFNIDWDLRNSFLRSNEQCAVEINHRMKKLTLQVILPKSRPPISASVTEYMRQKTRQLEEGAINKLSDGRWRIKWELDNPQLYERYLLNWEW